MNVILTPSTVVVPAERRCPRCGGLLGGFGPEGLCGACLFDSGLAVDDPAVELDLLAAGSRKFGGYELLEEIARGGMGVIFKARHLNLNRIVAVKMILRGEFASIAELARFRAEAETAARLQHPNIVAIHEVGECEGQPYFSMDYVEGQNLAQLVGNTPLPAARATKYLKTIAEAVQYAHEHGVLHRDLKPSNVLVDARDQPRVTDFGLAKQLDSQLSTNNLHLTQTGQVLGSPSFMPPEQAAGKNDAISPASDVYSLGAMLYHALTGRPPFVAESVPATLRLVGENEAVSPRLLNVGVPRDLETICLKCLQKEPHRRYATAQELADELTRFLNDKPIQARPARAAEKLWRWGRRNRALTITSAAALMLLLILAIGSPIVALRINRERLQAEKAYKFELELRQREKILDQISMAKTLCKNLKFVEAEKVMSDIRPPLPPSEARDAMTLFGILTDYYARQGIWKEASSNAAKGIEILPSDDMLYHSMASLLVALGDVRGYRQHNRIALARFRYSDDPHTQERIATDCVFSPWCKDDLAVLTKMAGYQLIRDRNDRFYYPFAQLTTSWIQYRQGDFSNSLENAMHVIAAGTPAYRLAEGYLLASMCQHQLGQHEAAQSLLAKGEKTFRTQMPSLKSRDLGKYWLNWIQARSLLNEAKALIEGNASDDTGFTVELP